MDSHRLKQTHTADKSLISLGENLRERCKRNINMQNQSKTAIKSIEETMNCINELSQKARRHVYVKIHNLCMAPAVVLHSGEQFVKIGDTTIVMTTKETLKHLEKKLANEQENLGILQREANQQQLVQEILAEYTPNEELVGMPSKVVSEQGIARKLAGGYEIIEEYDEKREIKRPNPSYKCLEDEVAKSDNEYFKRLEELEKQEMENQDLSNTFTMPLTTSKAEGTPIRTDKDLMFKMVQLLKNSDFYNSLRKDEDFCRYFNEKKNTFSNFDKMIESFIAQSINSVTIGKSEKPQEEPSNEEFSKYLDEIEM